MKRQSKVEKITRDLVNMTREEVRAYIKAISHGASENGTIQFVYRKKWLIQVFFNNGKYSSAATATRLDSVWGKE